MLLGLLKLFKHQIPLNTKFVALPVPKLIQVYVKPREAAFGVLFAPSWGRPGFSYGVKNDDFAWEVLKKWEVGDVNSTY